MRGSCSLSFGGLFLSYLSSLPCCHLKVTVLTLFHAFHSTETLGAVRLPSVGTPGVEVGSSWSGHQGVSALGLLLAEKAGCGAGNWAGQPPPGDEWEGAADPGTHPVYLAHRGTCVSSGLLRGLGLLLAPPLPQSPQDLGAGEEGTAQAPDPAPSQGPLSAAWPSPCPSSGHRAQASNPSHPCPAPVHFSAPRALGPPTCRQPCITGTHHRLRRGWFPSAFLNVFQSVSLHPSTRTPAYNIQHLSPRKHNPRLSWAPPTSLLFHLPLMRVIMVVVVIVIVIVTAAPVYPWLWVPSAGLSTLRLIQPWGIVLELPHLETENLGLREERWCVLEPKPSPGLPHS